MTDIWWTLVAAAEDGDLARGLPPSGMLSDVELERFHSFRFPARRQKYLLGRVAAKRLLSRAGLARGGPAAPPAAFTVANEASGAPYVLLDGRRLPWALSISHRHGLALAALACDPDMVVGADLETVEPRAPGLVTDFFTDAEAAAIGGAGPRTDTWVAVTWSGKEAALKALGLGLRADTRRIEVQVLDGPSDFPGWHPLAARVSLPSAPPLHAYWRDEGEYILTLAIGRSANPGGLQ